MGTETGDDDVSVLYFNNKDLGLLEETHYHRESEEIYIPIRGRGLLWIEGTQVELVSGQVVRVARGEIHRLFRIVEAPLEMYILKLPAHRDDKVVVESPLGLTVLLRTSQPPIA